MANVFDFIISQMTSINQIRQAAAQHNGQCVWQFAQALEPVRSVIGKSSTTKHGICELLSAKWVCETIYGRSMKEWLAAPTGSPNPIDIAKLSLLAQTHGSGAKPHVKDQDKATEAWMGRNRVKSHGCDDVGGSFADGGKFKPEDDLLDDLWKKVSSPRLAKPLFGLISMCGKKNAHTVAFGAAPINGAKIEYFDPNYGEFSFTHWNGFKSWFLQYFSKSWYSSFIGQNYSVRYFGKM